MHAVHSLEKINKTLQPTGRSLYSVLAELQTWLQDELVEIEQGIVAPEQSFTSLSEDSTNWNTYRSARHMVELSGKRLRPICTVLADRLVRADNRENHEGTRKLGIAAELVHNATLLHDDVIDQGDTRRNKPAAHMLYENTAAILGGDHLLVQALDLIHQANPAMLKPMLDTLHLMVGAEALQFECKQKWDTREATYMKIAHGKTASLFSWAFQAGGSMAQADALEMERLAEAGYKLGLVFQITDDILDLQGDSKTMGKRSGTDLREGKLTLPLIYLLESKPNAQDILEKIAFHEPSEQDYETVRGLLQSTGATDRATRKAQELCNETLALFDAFEPSRAQSILKDVTYNLLHRIF